MKWDADDLERTALHEAGHAVIAWSFGVTVGCVHLDDAKQGGHAKIASIEHLERFEQIAQWLAGFEAEQAFKPPARKRGAAIDCGEVSRILRENETPEDEPEGQVLREQGRQCAERRLRQHESKLRELARHLIEHRYIDRVEFEAMMQR
jgi:hypothetical protein